MTTPVLDGIRVLDFTRVIAGPYCTQILGDLGAEIIKIEQPGVGDEVRLIPPLYPGGESHYFLALNRNKKSVVVDIKSSEGRDIVLGLTAQVDVIVENFRPGVMDHLGLGFESAKAVKGDVIYCSISGYGQDGPLRDAPAFDLVTQARSGIMMVNGGPGTQPTRLGLPMGDLGGGLWASVAILAALRQRDVRGEAQHIDISLLDGVLALEGYLSQLALLTTISPEQTGNDHLNVAPYGLYRTSDGYIVVAILINQFWERLCVAIDRPDLTEDPRFATNAMRVQHRGELREFLDEILSKRTRAEWEATFLACDVPHGPVLDIVEALHSPQILERGLLRTFDHPTEGEVEVVGPPIRIDGASTLSTLHPPPRFGEHTRSVVRDMLGMATEQIDELIAREVVQVPQEPPEY